MAQRDSLSRRGATLQRTKGIQISENRIDDRSVEEIVEWCECLSGLIKEQKIEAHHVFNVDEIWCMVEKKK